MTKAQAIKQLQKMLAEAEALCNEYEENIKRAIAIYRMDAEIRGMLREDQLDDEEVGTRARERLRHWARHRDALVIAIACVRDK